MSRPLVRLWLPVLAGALGALPAWGQADTGTVEGRLVDEQDAAVSGASVTARQTDTGLARQVSSSPDGTFRLSALPPGSYDVTAVSGALAPPARRVDVLVATVTSVRFRLVNAVASMQPEPPADVTLPVSAPDVGQNAGPWALENLPLDGRRFQDLALLAAGAPPANDFGATEAEVGGLSASGTPGRQLSVTIDGAENTDGVAGGMLQQLGLDAVQEFRVVTQRHDAEHGHGAGGRLSVVTRSGTNEWSGGAFYQWRDQRLASRTYFEELAGSDEVPSKQQQFGATLGGPLRKDRAHVFLAYERNLRDDPAFVDTGGVLPAQDGPQLRPLRDELATAKLSLVPRANSFVTARYTLENLRRTNDLVGGDTPVPAGVTNTSRIHAAALKHTLARAGGALNELLVAFQSLDNATAPNDTSVPGIRTPDFFFGANPAAPTRTTQQRWQFKEDYSFRRSGGDGTHDFKLGLELQRTHYGGSFTPTLYGFFDFQGRLPAPADYLDEIADSFAGLAGGSEYDDDWTYAAAYLQDSWKPSQRLTIDAGLRYEVQWGPYANQLDTLALQSLKAANSDTRRSQDYGNLAPRVGFVFDLRGDGRTRLRGGYGRYYDEILQSVTQAEYWSRADHPTAFVELSPAPFTPRAYGAARESLNQQLLDMRGQVLYLTAPDLRQPSSDQANVGVSQRLGRHVGVDLDYVLAKGNDVIHSWYVNVGENRSTRVSPPGVFASQYGGMRVEGNRGHARFDGLYATARGRVRELEFWATYALTWAKDLADDQHSNPSDPSNLNDAKDYNWAANDVRQRATLAASYRLPVRLRLSSTLQYSSGKPFSALAGEDGRLDAARATDPASNPRQAFPRNECVVRGVDRCRAGKLFTWDARVTQGLRFGAERELELYVQAFNITNHANFDRDGYDTTYASPTFGQPTRVLAHSQRQAELGVRLRF